MHSLMFLSKSFLKWELIAVWVSIEYSVLKRISMPLLQGPENIVWMADILLLLGPTPSTKIYAEALLLHNDILMIIILLIIET